MESPFNRPVAANLIDRVITDREKRREQEPFLCGFSLEMTIYSALKEAGYLTDEAMVREEW